MHHPMALAQRLRLVKWAAHADSADRSAALAAVRLNSWARSLAPAVSSMDLLAVSTPKIDFSTLPHGLLAQKLFPLLSPRTLSVCACVHSSWRDLVAEQAWRQAFAALWPPPSLAAAEGPARGWQLSYAARQSAARCWLGRPSTDKLIAHRTAVKACCLLPEQDLLFTGGVDRTVRAWDLQSGVQLACSRRHGGTVRCVAADATLLASGSSDHAIRVWRAGGASSSGGRVDGSGGNPSGSGSTSSNPSSSSGPPFDLAGERAVLEGHAGPVSCLQLTPDLIVSGSWDCCVRLWDRQSLACVAMVHTDDWVSALAVKGGLLAAACGTSVLLFSLSGGALTRLGSLSCPSLGGGGADVPAAVTAVDCTADGRNVFIGTGDGGVWLADVSACCSPDSTSASSSSSSSSGTLGGSHPRPVLLQRQPAEVAGLSWDHPWLAVADRAGNVLLLDAGSCTAAGAAAVEGSSGAVAAAGRRSKKQPAQPALTSRVLFSASMGGAGAAAQCVCLGGTWAAAGLDCGTALSFDGSKGQQQLAAAAAARQQKADRRQRNLERQQQQQQRGGKGGGSGSSAKRSQPVPIPPRPAHSRQDEQPQQEQQASPSPSQRQQQQPQQGQPDSQQPPLSSSRGRSLLGRSPSARVPPPLPPEALAAASSCRQQAWHVLRAARPAGGGEGSAAGPAPQP